jgi:hypothetical protein
VHLQWITNHSTEVVEEEMIRKSVILIAGAILLLCILSVPAFAQAPGPVRDLGQAGSWSNTPFIDGYWAAWADDSTVPQVFVCDLRSGVSSRVSDPSIPSLYPDVQGSKVQWQGWVNGWYQIFLYDTDAQATTQLTTGDVDHVGGRVNQHWVTWIELVGPPEDGVPAEYRLMLLDLETMEKVELARGQGLSNAEMDGDWAAWSNGWDVASEIYAYNLKTGETRQLTHNDFGDVTPRVKDGLVVWYGGPPDSANNQAYSCSLPDGQPVRLNTNGADTGYLWTSAGRVVWTETTGKGDSVFLWDSHTSTTSRITYNPCNNIRPWLCGDWLTWETESPVHPSEIRLYHVPTGRTLKVSGQQSGERPSLGDGYLIWQNVSDLALKLCTFPADQAPVPDPTPFTDISASPYREAIEVLSAQGSVSGFGDSTFRPDAPLNRAQFAKMLALDLGLSPDTTSSSPFWDLGAADPDSPYPWAYVNAIYGAGLVKGTGPHSYSPWSTISRAQLVTMVVRAMNWRGQTGGGEIPSDFASTLGAFDPVHGPAMRRAEYEGLLAGLSDFGPGWDPWAPATRGETASLLWYLLMPY